MNSLISNRMAGKKNGWIVIQSKNIVMFRCFVVLVFLVIFCADVSSHIQPPPPFAFQFKALTWNMQDAQGGDNFNKWAALRNELQYQSYAVVALQECGGAPQGLNIVLRDVYRSERRQTVNYVPISVIMPEYDKIHHLPYVSVMKTDYDGTSLPRNLDSVKEYRWQIKTSYQGPHLYIERIFWVYHYYLPIDEDSNTRMNLAIVSAYRAEQVLVFADDTARVVGPTLGIRIGDAFFFSIQSTRENHLSNLTHSIVQHIQHDPNRQHRSWIMMGGFNHRMDSNDFVANVSTRDQEYTLQVIRPSMETNQSQEVLNYAVVGSEDLRPEQLMSASLVTDLLQSDHLAVRFDPLFQKFPTPNSQLSCTLATSKASPVADCFANVSLPSFTRGPNECPSFDHVIISRNDWFVESDKRIFAYLCRDTVEGISYVFHKFGREHLRAYIPRIFARMNFCDKRNTTESGTFGNGRILSDFIVKHYVLFNDKRIEFLSSHHPSSVMKVKTDRNSTCLGGTDCMISFTIRSVKDLPKQDDCKLR